MKLDIEYKEKSSLCKLEEKTVANKNKHGTRPVPFYKKKRTSELSETFSSIVAQESLHDHD